MSNWITLNTDHLKAVAHGNLIDRARTQAVGGIDPATEALADATARVRRAVATGNALDSDPSKVPNSLKAVTLRIAVFALMERIGLGLKEDQRETRRDDISDLKRISDNRIRVEQADDPAAGGEMQSSPSPLIEPRPRKFTTRTMDGV